MTEVESGINEDGTYWRRWDFASRVTVHTGLGIVSIRGDLTHFIPTERETEYQRRQAELQALFTQWKDSLRVVRGYGVIRKRGSNMQRCSSETVYTVNKGASVGQSDRSHAVPIERLHIKPAQIGHSQWQLDQMDKFLKDNRAVVWTLRPVETEDTNA